MSSPAIGTTAADLAVRTYRDGDGPAIMAIERRRHDAWRAHGSDITIRDLEEPAWSACVVITDAAGAVIGSVGARKVAELSSTFDVEKLTMHEWRDVLMRAWVKLGVELYKQGFKETMCRVVSPTPGWTNMLVKRGGFVRATSPVLFFDLEAALSGLTNPNE